MLLLVPTVSRSNLGLKENTLAGALYTLYQLPGQRQENETTCMFV